MAQFGTGGMGLYPVSDYSYNVLRQTEIDTNTQASILPCQ